MPFKDEGTETREFTRLVLGGRFWTLGPQISAPLWLPILFVRCTERALDSAFSLAAGQRSCFSPPPLLSPGPATSFSPYYYSRDQGLRQGRAQARRGLTARVRDACGAWGSPLTGSREVSGRREESLSRGGSNGKILLHASGNRSVLY